MVSPALSIIVPAYNAAASIDKCIASICIQTLPVFEILLIDDGSEDTTAHLCKLWAARDESIRFFSLPHKGVAAVRNFGLREARAEQIMFVDSDDYLESEAVACLLQLKKKYNAQIAIGGYVTEPLGGEATYPRQLGDKVLTGVQAYREALYAERLQTFNCMKVFDKALFEGIEYPEGEFLEDYQVIPLVYRRAKRIVSTSRVLYHYVQHEKSILNNAAQHATVHSAWATACAKRYQEAMASDVLSKRQKAFYRIHLTRQITRTALEYAERAARTDAQQEDNQLCLEKTLELLEKVYGKRVRIEELKTVLKKTIRQKALVKLFYW